MTDQIRGRGPHLGALAITTLALTVIGVVLGAVLSGGTTARSPFVPLGELTSRFRDDATAIEVSAFFQFAAAVPLGVLAAALSTRLRRMGVQVPGPSIGFFGGALAATVLALSALVSWTAAQPDVAASGAVVRALAVLSFLTGGTAYAVGIGLLVAGVAVPGVILGVIPRWLAWVGVVIAGFSELSALSLLVDPLQLLIPVARFGGGLWLVVAAFALTRHGLAAPRDGEVRA